MRRRWVVGGVVAALLLPGCVVRAGRPAPEVHVFGPAVVVGPARHFHAAGCGHPGRWHGGRWVYFVRDRWEYVDGGRTHVYRTLRSRPAAVAPAPARPARRGDVRRPTPRGSRAPSEAAQEYDPDAPRPRPAPARPR